MSEGNQDAWDVISNERARARRGAGGLVDALVTTVQHALTSGRRLGPRHVNLEHFVLEHGHYWQLDTKQPLPTGLPLGERGECHANAMKLASEHGHVTYVEGYVLSEVVPIRHAWVRLPNGEAVDTTLAGLEHVGTAEYFGVPFKTDHVLRAILKAGAYHSLVDDWEAGWPLLSASAEEMADVLWFTA